MSKLNDRTGGPGHQWRPYSESAIMLGGRTVLVVETEYIIALGVQSVLEALGAGTVVVANSAEDAYATAATWSGAVLAIVELEVNRPDLTELARQIAQSGISVLGITADVSLSFGVPELPGTPIVVKPVPDEDLAEAIRRRLAQNPLPDVT